VRETESRNHKFQNLIASSRLEIASEGRPKGYKTPNYKIYKYVHSKGLVLLFELEM